MSKSIFFVCILLINCVLYLSFLSISNRNSIVVHHSENVTELMDFKLSSTPSDIELSSIFFLKAHKCASSTVQNILMRYGYSRGLNFVLPETNNYIGNPEKFNKSMIVPELRTMNNKYHIFTHHTRYSSDVQKVMEKKAKFVTILRNPVDLYESLFDYYNLDKPLKFDLTDTSLKNPLFIKSCRTYRYMGKIGINQMCFDLGLSKKNFNNKELIDDFINNLEQEFDLIMMSEYMEASLVLLADLMNWSLENVASIKLNSRKRHKTLNANSRKSVAELNSADLQLYNYFKREFIGRVENYGIKRMEQQVQKLLDINQQLWFECVTNTNFKGYAKTKSYDIGDFTKFNCKYATKSELNFTEEIREKQIERLYVIKQLQSLTST